MWAHYWKRERAEDGEGTFVGHSASSVFRQRGVKSGDRMYVISVLGGRLRVIGRLDVEDVVTQKRADELFGRHVWEGTDHVVARPGSGTPRRLDAFVPDARLDELEFVGPDGDVDRREGEPARPRGRAEPSGSARDHAARCEAPRSAARPEVRHGHRRERRRLDLTARKPPTPRPPRSSVRSGPKSARFSRGVRARGERDDFVRGQLAPDLPRTVELVHRPSAALRRALTKPATAPASWAEPGEPVTSRSALRGAKQRRGFVPTPPSRHDHLRDLRGIRRARRRHRAHDAAPTRAERARCSPHDLHGARRALRSS